MKILYNGRDVACNVSAGLYVFFFFAISLSLDSCNSKNKYVKPIQKNITQAVYASGKVFPLNDYRVFAKLPGYIEKIHVKVNDTVQIGTPLVTLRSEVSEIALQTAKNLLDLANDNANEKTGLLVVSSKELEAAKSKYILDSVSFGRFENLLKSGATTKVLADQARTQFEISQQNYLKAQSVYDNTKDRLYIELKNAKNQYEAQSQNKKDYQLCSVMNGRVYDISAQEGMLASSQLPLLELGETDKFDIELQVDETDIALVNIGQSVMFEVDAYKDKMIRATVSEIYPTIAPGNRSAKVKAIISGNQEFRFYSGMSLEANIIISEKQNALVIPHEFLVNGNQVKIKGKKELVKVEKGVEDL